MNEEEWLATLDKRYRSIGKFTYEFSTLELYVGSILKHVIRLEQRFSRLILASYDFATLCKTTGACLKERTDDTAFHKQVDAVVGKCLGINNERVKIAHGSWFLHMGAFHTSRQSMKSKLYFQELEEIDSLSASISALIDEFMQLADKIDPGVVEGE